jgi:hypothetical protein
VIVFNELLKRALLEVGRKVRARSIRVFAGTTTMA